MADTNSKFDENELLSKIFEDLDISITDYDRAVKSYTAVGEYLEDSLGNSVNIYSQGSFAYRTVTRPYRQGKDAEYDIDLVCEYKPAPDDPETCKTLCGNALEASERYKKMLKDEEGRKTWTLEYAEVDEVDFHIDILPSKHATAERIQRLMQQDVPMKYAQTAIMITTKKEDGRYIWDDSNPKGYKAWLDDITSLYKQEERIIHKDSVERVPGQNESKTSVHRVIQILKRHRDVRFDKANKSDIKPISMIITTLAAKVAEANENKSVSIFELLELVIRSAAKVKELSEKNMRYDDFEESFIKRKDNGEWEIKNPVNPEENFADKWHENNSEKAKAFFQWVDWVNQDLLNPLMERNSVKAFKVLSEGLGSDVIRGVYKKMALPAVEPTINIVHKEDTKDMPKPWRSDESK